MNACKRSHKRTYMPGPHTLGAVALSVSLFAAGGALASELSGSSGLDAGVGVGAEVGAGTQAGDSTIGPGAEPGTAPGARTLPEGDVLDGDEVDELPPRAQLQQIELGVVAVHGAAEYIAVEAFHRREVNAPDDQMVETLHFERGIGHDQLYAGSGGPLSSTVLPSGSLI